MSEFLASTAMQLAAEQAVRVDRAPVMRNVRWHSFNLRTGRRGAPVPVVSPGEVSRFLSEATESTLETWMWRNGAQVPDWESSTQPATTMLVALDEDDNEKPIWGGMVYRRHSPFTKPSATLNLVTLEAYLDRRYINADVTFTGADQVSEIARTVVQNTVADGILLTVDAPASNWKRDREYKVDDDKTVLDVLDELEGLESGIEFTVDLGWTDDTHTVLERTLRIRNRIGTAYLSATGVATDHPASVFTMPGAVVDGGYLEDYSKDNGANAVVATSSGEGEGRPESMIHLAKGVVAGGGGEMARFERRFQPDTSILEPATLDQHAAREMQETWDGMKELTLVANLDTAPRFGVDWFLGDDVGVSLTNWRFPARINADGERLPGYQGNVRCTGLKINFKARTLEPRLLEVREVEVERL